MKTKRENLTWLVILWLFAGCGGNDIAQLAAQPSKANVPQKTILHHKEAKALIGANCGQEEIISLHPGQDHHHRESNFFFKHLSSGDKKANFAVRTCPVSERSKIAVKLPDNTHHLLGNEQQGTFHHPIALELNEDEEQDLQICSSNQELDPNSVHPLLLHKNSEIRQLSYAGKDKRGYPCWDIKNTRKISEKRNINRSVDEFLQSNILTLFTLGVVCIPGVISKSESGNDSCIFRK